ncbi:1-(5-phosphoribosyl)-5-[(5-phosphoribosylamino)methylideneamino]imidazole-4-carboxamide isomerase [bacterium]|nr:MAG: 1-(5-phosphoribosyl)-5-[(5-phosphoribosylamino)methylideneamino]imidazole-4-carboxamide isomerase [bacterium]
MLILPAIDLRGGKCVRLIQGDYGQETVYGDDPVAVARQFVDEGATWIHIVDLDGAKAGQPDAVHLAAVNQIRDLGVEIEFGGGIKDKVGLAAALEAGASRVVLGSAIVKDPQFAEKSFRELGERAVAGIDARDRKVAVHGWLETSEIDAVEMAVRVRDMGAHRIVLTDIARDGMLTGPNLELLREVHQACGLPIVQSGGIASLEDLNELYSLGDAAPEGVITGKAIYEGRFTVAQAVAHARHLTLV